MSVKTNVYASPTTSDTSRGPSNSIWASCPIEDLIQYEAGGIGTAGTFFRDDFLVAGFPTLNAPSSYGQWACFADTGTVLTDDMIEGGSLKFNNGTANKQIMLASTASSFRFASGATGFPLGQKMWFECRVAMDSITTATRDLFIGLCDNTTSQIVSANGTVITNTGNTLATTKGLFGFHFRATTNPSDVGIAFNVAGGTVQYLGAAANIQKLSLNYCFGPAATPGQPLTVYSATSGVPVANTFIKLGWVFDPNPTPIFVQTAVGGQVASNVVAIKPLIQFYVNGFQIPVFFASTEVQAATFPVNFMSPIIAINHLLTNGVHVDWIQVAQLASY